jgi:2-haloacid dehalogenase
MRTAIAFDVYGTLVDPLALADHVKELIGDRAALFAQLWRSKQLEYSFRRGLMRAYRPFSACTLEALFYTEKALGIVLSEKARTVLIERYKSLPAFADAAPGLAFLKRDGLFLAAFSNGEAEAVSSVLQNAQLLSLFDDIISVDEVRSFKPDPAVYAHAAARLGQQPSSVWLVSSNAFDVIGASAAGLRTAWIKREPEAVFDPWGVEPDLVASGLDQLAPLLKSMR